MSRKEKEKQRSNGLSKKIPNCWWFWLINISGLGLVFECPDLSAILHG